LSRLGLRLVEVRPCERGKRLMKFAYVGKNPAGKTIKGVIDAESEEKAQETLWKSEITITSLKQKKGGMSMQEMLPTLYAVKRQEIVTFTRDLHTLLTAGIGIYPSLGMLHDRAAKASMKALIHDILTSVESGSSFSDACARHPKEFSPFYLRMTKVGEEIGNLEQMLQQITVQMTKEAAIKKKVRGAMTLPAITLSVAVVAIVALVTFVVPAMKGLFEQFGGELPFMTRIMVGLSDFVKDYWFILLPALIIVIAGTIWYFKTPRGKRSWSTILLKTPLIRDVVLKAGMSRTARNLAILLGGGVPITEAMDLTIQTSDNHHFREAFVVVRQQVSEGLLLSQAMANHPIFPKLLTQVIGVGELTGKLEPNLESVADFYEMETDDSVTRATSMLTPIMTIVIGAVVALIAMSMYQPIYGIAGQLSAD
jgi:type IV pilus assembly protein PilC